MADHDQYGDGPVRRNRLLHPRENWKARVEEIGFHFYEIDGKPYWDESLYYEFTADEIDHLEEVTEELYAMCLKLVEHVVWNNLYDTLGIPSAYGEYIKSSWRARQPSIYGRFDFKYDGRSEPKLLEFNADTPTALFEASVVQYYWLQDFQPEKDQFNSIHEKLLAVMENDIAPFVGWNPLYFSCVRDNVEDYTTVEYLRDTAVQARLTTKHLYIDEVGYDAGSARFVDLEGAEMRAMFKLYPWEWIVAEPFADQLPGSSLVLLEPAWKMILSNKAILPLLWEMYPGHRNLLPSFFEPPKGLMHYVEKPFFSREGENIRVGRGFARKDRQVIYQEYDELPAFDGNYPVIGSWVVGSKAAGIGVREDTVPITNNMSRFVPHLFR